MLTFDDVLGWDPAAIHQVLQAAVNRADTLQRLSQNLQAIQGHMQRDFIGEAGQVYQDQMRTVSQEIEADRNQSQSIVAAVRRAEQDVSQCRAAAQSIQAAAQAHNLTITSDWQIHVVNFFELYTVLPSPLLVPALLQGHLNTLHAEANKADQELATAINVSLREPATNPNQEFGPFGRDINQINDMNQFNFNQELDQLNQELSQHQAAIGQPKPTISQVTPDQVNQLVNQANQDIQAMQREDQKFASEFS
jgi:uncharacterized protein YukE